MLDMARAREVFEASEDFTVGHRGGVRRSSIPRHARAGPALRGAARRRAGRRPVLAESVAGELIASEIEIRSGPRRRPRRRRARSQRDARARLFALAAERGRAAGAPPARIRGAPGRSSRSSTPSTTAASRTGSSTWPGATTPSACTCTWACAAPTGRSPSATGCAPVLPELLAISANSPFLDGRDSGLHSARTQIFTKSFPRCGIPDAVRRAGRPTPTTSTSSCARTRSSSTPSSGGACARTTRFGTVEVRICDAQTSARGVDGAGRPDRGLRRPGGARPRRGRAARARPARLIEENFWRAIRYGLDGQADRPRARRGVPGRGAAGDRLLAWTAPARAALGIELALPERERRPAPAGRAGRRRIDGGGLRRRGRPRRSEPTPRERR